MKTLALLFLLCVLSSTYLSAAIFVKIPGVPGDAKVAGWQEQNPDSDVFEDRELEVTSFLDISVEGQVQALARALLERGEPASKYGQG